MNHGANYCPHIHRQCKWPDTRTQIILQPSSHVYTTDTIRHGHSVCTNAEPNYIHMHTYIYISYISVINTKNAYTYIHSYKHRYIQTEMHTYRHTYMHITYTHKYICTNILYMHTYIHIYAYHTCIQVIHMYINA